MKNRTREHGLQEFRPAEANKSPGEIVWAAAIVGVSKAASTTWSGGMVQKRDCSAERGVDASITVCSR